MIKTTVYPEPPKVPVVSINYKKEATRILNKNKMFNVFSKRIEGIETEQDYINFFTANFPRNSLLFKEFRKIVGKKYIDQNKDELVYVKDRVYFGVPWFYNSTNTHSFLRRSLVEFNPDYIQEIVSCIPIINKGDGYDVVLQYANKGDMQNYTTMISGHAGYVCDESCVLSYNIQKELLEETGIFKDSSQFFNIGSIDKYKKFDYEHINDISFYHTGNIFGIFITEEEFKNIQNEKGLIARRYPLMEDTSHLLINPDSWIEKALELVTSFLSDDTRRSILKGS